MNTELSDEDIVPSFRFKERASRMELVNLRLRNYITKSGHVGLEQYRVSALIDVFSFDLYTTT